MSVQLTAFTTPLGYDKADIKLAFYPEPVPEEHSRSGQQFVTSAKTSLYKKNPQQNKL